MIPSNTTNDEIDSVRVLIAADPGSNAGARVLFISNDPDLLEQKYKTFKAAGIDCYYDQCETVLKIKNMTLSYN